MAERRETTVSAGDRLLQVLRDRCADAVTAGARLPPEPRLAQELGVSRPLLREALSRLEHEGLLRRRRGEPTSVNVAVTSIRYWFDRQEPYAVRLGREGMVVTEDTLSVAFRRATDDDVEALGVEGERWVITTRKRWRGDGTVVAIVDSFIPLPPGVEPADVSAPTQTKFDLVRELYGEDPEWEITHPTATMADAALIAQFEIAGPAALLTLKTIGVSVSGTRLYHALENYPPGGLDWAFVRTFRPG